MELLNEDCVRRALALLRPLVIEHPHLSYEQLEALAEGRLAVTGTFEVHVRECRICSNELRDLEVFVALFRQGAR